MLSDDLTTYVKLCDANGGVGSLHGDKFFKTIDFGASDTDLDGVDPFSDHYYDYQIALYNRIADRNLDQVSNEQSELDVEFHSSGSNPYHNIVPSHAAFHLLRLAKLMRLADVPFHGKVVDMGAGWGMSSEIAAYLGCKLTAVDINPRFLALINRRSTRLGLPVECVLSTFEGFHAREPVNMVMFYESLHHATKPWALINHLAPQIHHGGCIAIAGEPINDFWWKSWGMRLDPISVYCMRKYGWFESGWSLSFICECFRRSGLVPNVFEDTDLGIGQIIIARKS